MALASRIAGGTLHFLRRHPGLIGIWSLVYLAGTALSVVLMRPVMLDLVERAGNPPETATAILPALIHMLPIYIATLALMVVLVTGAMRAVLYPDQHDWAYLRLGMDELRLFGLGLLLVVGLYVGMIVLGFVLAIAGILLTLVIGKVAGAILAIAAMMIVSVWLAIRLSIAFPLTLLRRRIVIGEAWRLTRRHAGALFLGYFLLGLLMLALGLTGFLVARATGIFPGFPDPANPDAQRQMMAAQMEMMRGVGPGFLLTTLVGAIIGAVSLTINGVAAAIACRQLTSAGDAEPA